MQFKAAMLGGAILIICGSVVARAQDNQNNNAALLEAINKLSLQVQRLSTKIDQLESVRAGDPAAANPNIVSGYRVPGKQENLIFAPLKFDTDPKVNSKSAPTIPLTGHTSPSEPPLLSLPEGQISAPEVNITTIEQDTDQADEAQRTQTAQDNDDRLRFNRFLDDGIVPFIPGLSN